MLIDPVTLAVRRIIAPQYNRDAIARTLQVHGVGGVSGDRFEVLLLKGLLAETVKRHSLQASVTTELPRLLKNGRLAVEDVAVPRIFTGSIQLMSNNPTQIEQQIAQSVGGEHRS